MSTTTDQHGRIITKRQLQIAMGGAGWQRSDSGACTYHHRDTGKEIDLNGEQPDGRQLWQHLCESGVLPSKRL